MQFQYTPQLLVKAFKRHYYKVSDIAKKLAASNGKFSFSFSYNKDKGQEAKVETPDDEMSIRFVVLMRRFLNPASNLCTAPIRLDTKCVVVSSYRVDLTALASIGFQTRLE